MRKIFTEFCNHSTIHGVRYFAERRRHWSERLWWIIALSSSIYLCSSLIHNVWMKWYEKPVTLDLSEQEEPISKIPFPTVTICPQAKFDRHKLDFVSTYNTWKEAPENVSDIAISRMRTLLHICASRPVFSNSEDEKFTNSSIYEIMEDMAISVDDSTGNCEWRKQIYPCSDLFEPIFTDNGLCFVFNALDAREMYTDSMAPELMTVKYSSNISNWNFETGYNRSPTKDYPNRIFNTKQFGGLYITLYLHSDQIEYLCAGVIEGFKVFLTTPGETRSLSAYYYQVLFSEQAEIFIKPKQTTTSEKLRKYTPTQRQCFFNSERQLRFFQIYSQANCQAECLSNFTQMECGCVKFSMPRDQNTTICGSGSIECYREAEDKLFGEEIIDEFANDTVKMYRENCNCLPACTSIQYVAYIDRTKFNFNQVLNALGLTDTDYPNYRMAALSIYFSDPQVTTFQRIETQTYTDFFANIGGLLGLFLGISLLSIIEFIYYSTLRLYWTIRRSKAETDVVLFERRAISCIPVDPNHERSFNGEKPKATSLSSKRK